MPLPPLAGRLTTPRGTFPAGAAGASPLGRPQPDALLYALAATMWAYVWRIQDVFKILALLEIPLLALGISIVLFASDRDPRRRVQSIRSPLFILLLSLLALLILSVPGAIWPGRAFWFVVQDFGPTFVLMVMIASAIRDKSDVEWLAWANLLGAFVYASYVMMAFSVGSSGRLGNLVFYDANDFALVLICTLPFALHFARKGVPGRRRALALAAFAIFVVQVMRSGSRGGFLAFLALMTYVLIFYRGVPARVRLATVAAGIGILAVAASATYWETMRTLLNLEEDYNMQEQSGRKQLWERGIGYMTSHPVLGVGARNFPQAEGSLSEVGRQRAAAGRGFKWSVAHNSFVEIGAEAGVGALLLFVSVIGLSVRMMSRISPKRGPPGAVTPRDQAFAQTLIASFIGFCVAGFFVSAEYFTYLYVLFAFVMGFTKVVYSAPPTEAVVQPRLVRVGRGGLAPVRALGAWTRGGVPPRGRP